MIFDKKSILYVQDIVKIQDLSVSVLTQVPLNLSHNMEKTQLIKVYFERQEAQIVAASVDRTAFTAFGS